MRTFSRFEKYALGIMTKDNPSGMSRQNLETLVGNMFYSRGAEFIFDHANKTLTIRVYANKPEEYTLSNVIANELVELMVLIEYLNSLYLSRLYNMGVNIIARSNNVSKKNGDPIDQITDKIIYEFYSSHWNDFFYVSDELRHIVNDNNYKTDSQIQVEQQLAEAIIQSEEARTQTGYAQKQTEKAQKQVRNGWIAIIIALAALVSSIILPFCIKEKNVNAGKENDKIRSEYIITTPKDSTLYKILPIE